VTGLCPDQILRQTPHPQVYGFAAEMSTTSANPYNSGDVSDKCRCRLARLSVVASCRQRTVRHFPPPHLPDVTPRSALSEIFFGGGDRIAVAFLPSEFHPAAFPFL